MNRFTGAARALRQCAPAPVMDGSTLACMEKIMSKTNMHNSEAKLEVRELVDDELDAVSGGSDYKAIEIKDYGFGVSMPVTTS